MRDKMYDLDQLRQLVFEYMLNNEVSKLGMSQRIGLSYHTMRNFLDGSRKPTFVSVAKIINFFKRENEKYDNAQW